MCQRGGVFRGGQGRQGRQGGAGRAGNEINAKEYTAVLSATCDSKGLTRAYYTEALDTPEQADAAIAIMDSGLRNMRMYIATGTKCGFRRCASSRRSTCSLLLSLLFTIL